MAASEKKPPVIRGVYNPDQQEIDDVRFVYQRKWDIEQSPDRVRAMRQAEKGLKAWENWREDKSADQWQSNHIVPMTFSVIETAMSEVIELQLRPSIRPQGEEDAPRAMVMGHAFNYSCEVSSWDKELSDVWFDGLVKGTAIGQEYYWADKRMVQNVMTGKDGKDTTQETEVLDYDDVYMENVRLEDMFIDEKARDFTGPYAARDCIRRYIMNIDDFKAFFSGEIWDPLGNAKYVKPGGDINYYEFYTPPEGINKDKDVEVLWYWSTRPHDRLWIVANDVMVRKGPNPYKHKQLPFARFVDVKRTHSFYGKGEPEILESVQNEADTIRRMTIDRAHLDIDKMFIVSSRVSLNDEDLIARPHGMIPSDDMNMTKPVEYGDTPQSVETSYKHLEDDSVIGTGINPRAQSLPTAGSATEAAILKESTLKRIRKKIWIMKKEFLPRISQLRVANIIQFYSQPRLEKVVGEAATQEYVSEVAKLKDQGLLVEDGKDNYKKSYRQIALEGKQLSFDTKGKINESTASGTTFFTMKPDYFMPISRGGFTIKFGSESDIEISKPLQRQQDLELFDRLIAVAQNVQGSYDPTKLGDMLLKGANKNPADFKPDQQPGQGDSEQRLQILLELASQENKMMVQGNDVPPTPNANPAHTMLHIEFIKSDGFPPNNVQLAQRFTNHIQGEILAEGARQGQDPSAMAAEAAGGGSIAPGGAAAGITNRPGGMAKPTAKMGSILPAVSPGNAKGV